MKTPNSLFDGRGNETASSLPTPSRAGICRRSARRSSGNAHSPVRSRPRRATALISIALTALAVYRAEAILTFTDQVRGAYGSIPTWEGIAAPGATVTITYPAVGGGTGTVVFVANAITGRFRVDQPANVARPGTASGSTSDGCNDSDGYVSNDLDNHFTDYTVLAQSSVTVAGNAFSLAGGFTARPVTYDGDPLSATYGDLFSRIDPGEFVMTASGLPGNVDFLLNVPIDININLLPILPVALGGGGLPSMSIGPIGVSGIVNTDFAGSGNYSGILNGTLIAGDLQTTLDLDIDLISSFGPITGHMVADGITTIPEPARALLFLAGALAVLLARRRGSERGRY